MSNTAIIAKNFKLKKDFEKYTEWFDKNEKALKKEIEQITGKGLNILLNGDPQHNFAGIAPFTPDNQ